MAVAGAPYGPREPARFSYIYRASSERRGSFSKVFYGLLVASQFIPSVRDLAAATR